MRFLLTTLSLVFFAFSAQAQTQAPIEAYGESAEISNFDLSPDGSRFAFFLRKDGQDMMVVFEQGKGNIGAIDITEVKARGLYFVSNNHVIISASDAYKYGGGIEWGQSWTYNVETGELSPLTEKEQRFRHIPSTAGGSMTPTDDPDIVYYTVWGGDKGDRLRAYLVEGNLKTRRARIVTKGGEGSYDWAITKDGRVMAREDFDDNLDHYELYTQRNGTWELVYEERSPRPSVSMIGYFSDESALLVRRREEEHGSWTLHRLEFDGTFSEPIYESDTKLISTIYLDPWSRVVGFRYAGMKPSYFFFDQNLDAVVKAAGNAFPQDSVTLYDWTDDYSQLIFSVSGGSISPSYFLYNGATNSFGRISHKYTRIADEQVMPVRMMEYAARDGLAIPSLITHPKGKTAGAKLPLLVIPHGGPEAYSTLGFHDWAQYFASRGYVVLEPNFRGSAGFGAAHRNAGFGEWGRKMQDDITDGVNHLIETGWADPDRVCIVGASYGGYAALAGGAFTPDLYQCIVAVAPVSDVSEMLDRIVRYRSSRSSSLDYWEDWLGDRKEDRASMDAISPINHAGDFKAPTLIIHGTDDTVVPFQQGERMAEVLENAGKDVKFVRLEGEDHWLSQDKTRLQALREMDSFIREHLGPAQ